MPVKNPIYSFIHVKIVTSKNDSHFSLMINRPLFNFSRQNLNELKKNDILYHDLCMHNFFTSNYVLSFT